MKQIGPLRKPDIRKFIRSELASSNDLIKYDDWYSIFKVNYFDRYIVVSTRSKSIVNDANGFGFRSVESATRLLEKLVFEERYADAISDYAGYSIYDL